LSGNPAVTQACSLPSRDAIGKMQRLAWTYR